MASSEINLVMTAIGFAISSMFIVYVCARLICARILLYYNPSHHTIIERGCNGLDPFVINSFPRKKYSDAFTSIQDAQCAICLEDYQSEDNLCILPSCAHYFHTACIDLWFRQKSTCPVCRISLQQLPEKRPFTQPFSSSVVQSPRHVCSMFTSSRTHNNEQTIVMDGGVSSV